MSHTVVASSETGPDGSREWGPEAAEQILVASQVPEIAAVACRFAEARQRTAAVYMLGAGDGVKAIDETDIRPFDLESTINAACLFAVAASVAAENGADASAYRRRACEYVLESARQHPNVGFLRTDKDLNRGIARSDLDWLLDHALTAGDQAEERLRAIAAGRPLRDEPDRPPSAHGTPR